MARVNFIVSFLVCISCFNIGFCSEDIEKNELEESNKFVGSTSSKLFEDENEFEDDELENIFMTSRAKQIFLAIQDIQDSEDEGLKYDESKKTIDEDYFLIGNGCDIESVVVGEVSQLNANKVHSDLGLAYFDYEDIVK